MHHRVSRAAVVAVRAIVTTISSALLLGALACSSDTAASRVLEPGSPRLTTGTVQAPSAPQNVKATAGNASATVTWLAPATPGTYATEYYRVVASPGGKALFVAASQLKASMTGLTNGTTYTFVVYAVTVHAAAGTRQCEPGCRGPWRGLRGAGRELSFAGFSGDDGVRRARQGDA